jgi:hypothetical protein
VLKSSDVIEALMEAGSDVEWEDTNCTVLGHALLLDDIEV